MKNNITAPNQHTYTQSVFSWRDAIRKAQLTSTQKTVAIFISLYMNEFAGGAFPSYNRLASDCSLSRTSVINSVSALVDAGFLLKETKFRRTGSHTSNHYECSYPEWCSLQPTDDQSAENPPKGSSPDTPQGVHDVHEGGKPDALGVVHTTDEGGTPDAPHYNSSIITPPEYSNLKSFGAGQNLTLTAQFEHFWKEYGQIGNRKSAFEEFAKALKKASFAQIIEGLTRYQNYIYQTDTEAQYIKHASNWLDREGWADSYRIPKTKTQSDEAF